MLTPAELARVSARTVGHYDAQADSFWEGTRTHDVSQNINALLAAIEVPGPLEILDLGCGPGRDLVALQAAGHRPTGLDGAARFCTMARRLSGCPVWHQDMLDVRLPEESFDGIFANASLFHVPSQILPALLSRLFGALRPGGVLFSSVPRGPGIEGWQGERYGTYLELPTWQSMKEAAGFVYVDHYYRPPGRPRAEQPWLASTWRRPSGQSSDEGGGVGLDRG
jgi:SAM-dependent methyltransferase